MPELPDLQVFSANLHKRLAGNKLSGIKLMKGAKANASKAALEKALKGDRLIKVYREGKELRLAFKKGNTLGIHLMLRGKLSWLEDRNTQRHTLLELYFEKGRDLVLSDYQSNARITLNPPEARVPDALSKQINSAFWKEKLRSRATIKNLLLDQKVIRGIGNAYADEILWQARVSPFSISNKIPPAKVTALAKSLKTILKNAEKQIRKEEPGIIGGELRDFLLIHNAKKNTSPGGKKILKKMTGGRRTYYTAEQKLFT